MRKGYRKVIWGVLLISLVGVALFPKEVFFAALKWQVNRYCHEAFGARFTVETLFWEQGEIVLQQGKIEAPGTLLATFERVRFTPFLDFKKREVGGKALFTALKIVHHKHDPQAIPSPPPPSLPFFNLCLETTIQEGELELYDERKETVVHQHLYFDLDHHVLAGGVWGEIAFFWDLATPKFVTHFDWKREEPLILSSIFQNHSCAALSQLASYFVQDYLPPPAQGWMLLSGQIEGAMTLELVNGEPFRLKGEVEAKEVQGENRPLALRGYVEAISCSADIDFSCVSAINGVFALQGGHLSLIEESRPFWPQMGDFRDLHSTITIREGKVEKSTLRGCLMGMEGEMQLDWGAQGTVMEMSFRGPAEKVKGFLPQVLQKGFEEAFPTDFFSLEAALLQSGEGLELEGELAIDAGSQESYQLNFGCLLGKVGELPEVVPEALRYSFSQSVGAFLDHLKDQFCLSQKRFGWFKASHLPLEKFLSPFLLGGVEMDLKGRAHLEGTFDERYVALFWEGEGLCLESSHFTLTVPAVGRSVGKEKRGVHYLDLTTWDHVGIIPLHKAHYHQKNYDFVLEEGEALAYIENNAIHIQEITTHFEKLELKGNVALAIHSLSDVDLFLQADAIAGPIASTRHFLSHFNHAKFWELPLEGRVEGGEKALFFHYHFIPKATLVEGSVRGKCHVDWHHSLFDLTHYQAEVFFDWNHNRLEIKEGEGNLQLGLTSSPLQIATPSVTLHDFPHFLVEGECVVKEDEKQVAALLAHATRVGETREFFIEEVGKEGSPLLHAQVEGGKVKLVAGHWGEWEGTGSFLFHPGGIEIEELSAFSSSTTGVSLKGKFDQKGQVWTGELKEIHWDLATLGKKMPTWQPYGYLVGKGTFYWKIGGALEARATTSFTDLAFGGIHFGSGENLFSFFSSTSGLTVEGLEVELVQEGAKERYKLGAFHYDPQKQKVHFDGFDFSLPPEKLPWVAEVAKKLFPGKVQGTTGEWVEMIKHNEPLEGRFSLEIYPESAWFYLSLKDGLYHIGERAFDLKNFRLIYDPLELHIWTQCRLHDYDYGLHFTADALTLKQGKLFLSDRLLSPGDPAGMPALCASWKKGESGWEIHRVTGGVDGVEVDLAASLPTSTMHLEGRVAFAPEKLTPFLPPETASLWKQLGPAGQWTLEGVFGREEAWDQWSFKGTLLGNECVIYGTGLGTCFAEVEYGPGRVNLSDIALCNWAGNLYVEKAFLTKNEKSWELGLEQLKLSELHLARLKSPWTQWQPREKPFLRSLLIRSLELHQLTGHLPDLGSLKGSGTLEFANVPRKTFVNNLLFLPAEITAWIGLDLTTLVPASGIIEYEVKNGKILFNEFKEMFSEGKRSRFYLAEGAPAYIGLDGKMNFKVKMKQYNLLMKLAEFFTISVRGTLLKPTYTLTNGHEESS